MYEVKVNTAGATIAVGSETTVLEAALAAGIAYPHGCRSGRCGGCKSRLISGQVDLLRHTPFALTEEEKAQGLILACRAQPRTDCEVSWLGSDTADHPLREERARVVSIENATHDIKVIRLALMAGGPLAFSAGQYAEITFPSCPPRNYSMANQPGADLLEFHVRHVPGGAASTFAATALKVGDSIRVRGPFGAAHLRTRHAGPIIAVAGGSGLAPITSIVEAALTEGLRQPIRVYFGARSERDIYLEERFKALTLTHRNLSFITVLSDQTASTSRRTGLVTAAIGSDWPDVSGWKAYLAGPPPMVEAATELLLARGLRSDDLHADAFYTTADQAAA
jgi:ferredoxin-NAD(P)+ reductase (naphthalene dioxygenase ferredoxin-specific)